MSTRERRPRRRRRPTERRGRGPTAYNRRLPFLLAGGGVVVIIAVVAVVAVAVTSGAGGANEGEPVPTTTANESRLIPSDGHSLGSQDAPVTMVEFFNFT